MNIEKLERRDGSEGSRKLVKAYNKLQAMIEALGKKEIPQDEMTFINARIKVINSFIGSEKELTKELKRAYSQLLKFINEKLKFVTKHHYLSLGMVFGLLAGVVFGSVFNNNFEFMGIGSSQGMAISMGMLIGIVIGTNLDKQAKKNGRQLDLQ